MCLFLRNIPSLQMNAQVQFAFPKETSPQAFSLSYLINLMWPPCRVFLHSTTINQDFPLLFYHHLLSPSTPTVWLFFFAMSIDPTTTTTDSSSVPPTISTTTSRRWVYEYARVPKSFPRKPFIRPGLCDDTTHLVKFEEIKESPLKKSLPQRDQPLKKIITAKKSIATNWTLTLHPTLINCNF